VKAGTDDFPERLVDGAGPAADLLRRFTRQAPHAPGENAAWDGTLARLGRDAGRYRGRLVAALVLGAVTGAAALYVALSPHAPWVTSDLRPPSPGHPVPVTAGPVAATATDRASQPAARSQVAKKASPPADAPHIRLGRAAVGLPVGAAELVGEADVNLSPDGTARAYTTPAAATVELGTGVLDLHVEKRHAEDGHAFEVAAGPYRFTVLGTMFRVSRVANDVTLSVTEGRVAVSQGKTALAIITAGGFWSGTVAKERAPHAAPSSDAPSAARGAGATTVASRPSAARAPQAALPATTVPPDVRTAGVLASGACAARADAGDPAGAADCFTAAATGDNLGAEVSLYEAARLYRDALGQPERAVAALQEARRRWPAGALATEVSLSLAELLPKLGRYRQALDEAQALLDRHPGGVRAAELHLLRGDVLRAGLARCPAAESEYAAAAATDDPRVADAAAFWRAACLETDGHRAEARAAFASYLARAHPQRRAEAARRLQGLDAGDR